MVFFLVCQGEILPKRGEVPYVSSLEVISKVVRSPEARGAAAAGP
jgi:hypothetical protein